MPSATPAFDVVMLGGDIGVYALARAFHEAYGVRSTVISRIATGPVDSAVIDNVLLGIGASNDDHISELLRRGRERARHEADRADEDRVPVILLANTDGYARLFARHRAELDRYYRISLVDETTLDRIADKGRFAEACERVGVPTPLTHIEDFAGADDPDWTPSELDLPFPVVAKAAASSEHELVDYPGKKKVNFVETPHQLADLWRRVRESGFRDRFVVQELVPGDDTWMRSVTAYRDHRGVVTLMCTAQVLLEEHTPSALGNPCAMITTPFTEAMDHARSLLDHLDYRGFANFDAKVDPRDGSFRFLEVNPRIGRNNYYVTGAGANVARFIVADLIEDRSPEPVTVTNEIVYSVLPKRLLLRYITDPDLKRHVKKIMRKGIVHPLVYRAEGWRRRGYVLVAKANHVKKFMTYYPKPTESGF
ncbi:carboxylate--amine ligase [Nostocoides sp. F2B08]|uniref:carboxylate--amine ligase n=1 Tax=Nostocoides sp. F2B08 TaxID=2653936 RepID=UPI00126358D2|nr:carboxylate--amine ligase [Tetrasphaera sp. F2B08]KAB7741409.1 carboxylate--amine ligase [Tetrasphaera sp. F2B08]